MIDQYSVKKKRQNMRYDKIVFAIIFFSCGLSLFADLPQTEVHLLIKANVLEVINGDTLKVKTIDVNVKNIFPFERVKLLGVISPAMGIKSEYYAKEARDFTKKYLLGKNVVLELGKNKRDKFGFLLAYVWTEDKILFNRILLQEGCARFSQMNVLNEQILVEFQLIDLDNRAQSKGMWGKPN